MVTKTKPRTKKPTTARNRATKTTKTISAKKTGGASRCRRPRRRARRPGRRDQGRQTRLLNSRPRRRVTGAGRSNFDTQEKPTRCTLATDEAKNGDKIVKLEARKVCFFWRTHSATPGNDHLQSAISP